MSVITNGKGTTVGFQPGQYVVDLPAGSDAGFKSPTYLKIKTAGDLVFEAWDGGTNTETFTTTQIGSFFQVPVRNITGSGTTATFEAYQ